MTSKGGPQLWKSAGPQLGNRAVQGNECVKREDQSGSRAFSMRRRAFAGSTTYGSPPHCGGIRRDVCTSVISGAKSMSCSVRPTMLEELPAAHLCRSISRGCQHTIAVKMTQENCRGLQLCRGTRSSQQRFGWILVLKFRRIRRLPPIGKKSRYPALELTVQARQAQKSRSDRLEASH